MYSVGDKVVYLRHGAGEIVGIEEREVPGKRREYLTIEILHSGVTAMIPVDNTPQAGLRRVVSTEGAAEVLEILRGGVTCMPERWHARSKHNLERLDTGNACEIAHLVRDLAMRDAERGLPLSERQLLTKAECILASELMYARGLSEEEAKALIERAVGGATG